MTTAIAAFPNATGVWVDAVNGNDATGVRGQQTKPFATIQAGIDAAVSGDAVFVFPGTYTGLVVCKNNVSVFGLDEAHCIISRASAVAENVVTMAETMRFGGFTMNLAPTAGLTDAVLFGGTSNVTSALVEMTINGSGAGVVRIYNNGTATVIHENHITMDRVRFVGVGFANGLQHGTLAGPATIGRYINCSFSGLIGIGVAAGVAITTRCRSTGVNSLNIVAGTSLFANDCVFSGTVSNAGTYSTTGTQRVVDPVTVRDTTTVAVLAAVTIISTLPAIQAQGNMVTVHFSGIFDNTLAGTKTLTLMLFRDGVEVNVTDRYQHRMDVADDNITIACHWVDTSLTLTAPVYTVRAIGSAVGINALLNRRATATY